MEAAGGYLGSDFDDARDGGNAVGCGRAGFAEISQAYERDQKERHMEGYLFLCILGFAAGVQSAPAQYIEVNAEIVGISRGSNSTTGKLQESRRVYHVQCIVGTNRWMMAGDFPLNARETYWCTGSNIILRTIITPLPLEMRLRQAASQIADELLGRKPTTPPLLSPGRQPKVGEQYTSVIASTDPNGLGLGYNKVPWLAFCSGPFLQSSGRRVPVPIGVNPNFGYLKNYSDSTLVFPDALGLPKRMELHTPDHHLLCEYTVEETTNLLGWTFPMRFKIVQSQSRSERNLGGSLARRGQGDFDSDGKRTSSSRRRAKGDQAAMKAARLAGRYKQQICPARGRGGVCISEVASEWRRIGDASGETRPAADRGSMGINRDQFLCPRTFFSTSAAALVK